MITTIVRFALPAGVQLAEATALFERSAHQYRQAPGLVRKYYLYGDGPVAGGVYLWRDRASAEAFHSASWRSNLRERLGADPEVTYFDTPVIVDNVGAPA